MLIPEGKVALCSFSIYVLLSLFLFFGQQLIGAWGIISASLALVLGWTPTLVVPYTAVSRRAAFLGCVFGFSLHLSLSNTLFVHFGWYLASLSFFHFSEYMMIAIYIPGKLSLDSFLLNHSTEYQIAAAASWFEFLLELWLFPNLKRHCFISCIGLVLMIGGEVIRKLAMITAKSNFSHIVESRKEKGHVLVTQGVYSLCRHPSYVGWFWWSIGNVTSLYGKWFEPRSLSSGIVWVRVVFRKTIVGDLLLVTDVLSAS